MKLTEKDAIWCKTQKQWDSIIEKFKIKSISHEQWSYSGCKSCIRPITEQGGANFMDLGFYRNKGYTIHKAKDILKKSKIKELEKRVSKIEKVVSDNTTISKMESVEPLKFDLPKKELEELPEKWCVALNKKSYNDLNNWGRSIYPLIWGDLARRNYVKCDLSEDIITSSENIPQGYTEITFDQFKKWVLKEETEIDWSKAGQLVENTTDYFLITNGVHSEKHFEATPCNGNNKGFLQGGWIKSSFKLCTEPITLKNE